MRLFSIILAALLLAGPALADKDSCSVISNAFNPTEAGATDDIFNLTDGTFSATAADEDEFIVPVQVRVSSLRFDVDVAPGASDIWLLTIADDGRGIARDAPGQEQGTGFGIANIRERTRELGGRCDLASTPGHGARLSVTIPCNDPAPG